MPPYCALPLPGETASEPSEAERFARLLPLVRAIVSRVVATLPRSVEAADLYSVGLTGLAEAIRRFDDRQGTPLEAYAARRIRGAVLDELRRLDPLSRRARRQAREFDRVFRALEQEQGGAPSDRDLATGLGCDATELERIRRRTAPVRIVPLDEPIREDGGSSLTRAETLADPSVPEAWSGLESTERRELVRDRLARLPDRPRLVLEEYYLRGRKLAEIAVELGVTEARVSQIHGEGLQSLRRSLSRALES